jgi:Undecaprenyl-phosphate galactose phosphotransferase WbaP
MSPTSDPIPMESLPQVDTEHPVEGTAVRSLSGRGSTAPQVVPVDRRRHPRVPLPDHRIGSAFALRAALTSIPLVVSDVMALTLAFLLARGALALVLPGVAAGLAPPVLLFGVGLVVANAALGLYPGIGLHSVVELRQSATAVFLLFGAFALAEWFRGDSLGFLLVLVLAGGMATVAVPLMRVLTRRLSSRIPGWMHPMLVIGAEQAVRRIVGYFDDHPGLGLRPIPLYLDSSAAPPTVAISSQAREHDAMCAALALGGAESGLEESFLVRYCASLFPSLVVIPGTGVLPSLWTRATDVGGVVGVQTGTSLLRPGPRALKRTLDCTVAIAVGVLTLPLLAVTALAIKLTSRGPLFYGQRRIGRGRREFTAWKFRTMHANADEILQQYLSSDLSLRREWARDHKLRNDPRVTLVGKLLRRTSLDELPQLWNILRGEMSLVGPRPIVSQEIPKYGQEFGMYLSVPPGLSGLWQVSGRNRTTYEERVAFDSYYVENWSVWLDVYILARTVTAVLTADGAY